MKVGIVGNRSGFDYEFVKKKLLEKGVNKMDILISGGAEGVDTFAQQFAKEIGAQIRILYPDPGLPSPKRYFDRNEKIAMMCDKLIAFNRKEKSGTLSTVNYAKKLDKEVIVIEK